MLTSIPRPSPSSKRAGTSPGDTAVPFDIPPLPMNLMSVEDIGGMQFARIDCPAIRERQSMALSDPLCDLAERAGGRLTLDLSLVAAFCCSWINVLLTVSKRCRLKGGSLILTGLSAQACQTLKQMGLHKQFTIR